MNMTMESYKKPIDRQHFHTDQAGTHFIIDLISLVKSREIFVFHIYYTTTLYMR